ncbi:MAG: hypothetical protein KFF49_07545, partial [Bacteroidales bacterium]|nr:hypothetical protein [Bacteroidales bacterium]
MFDSLKRLYHGNWSTCLVHSPIKPENHMSNAMQNMLTKKAWQRLLKSFFRNGTTTGIYAGCPVGKYRLHIVKAI